MTSTSTTPSSSSFAYVECDVPAEQTLSEWRDARNAASQAERRVRRAERLARLWRRPRWAT